MRQSMLMPRSVVLPGSPSAVAVPHVRLDRAISLRLVRPMLQLLHRRSRTRIPILMYHGVDKGTTARHSYFETNVSPELFDHHMQFLRENGYRSITLGEAVAAVHHPLNENRFVVITFDDGYRNFYTDALPILNTYGFSATVFIASGLTRDQRTGMGSKEFMTWEEVRRIQANGIQIGSHTVTHPQLRGLSVQRVADEIRHSKQTIEAKLGRTVESFSYPFAFPGEDRQFLRAIRNLLQMNGYKNGVCTTIGTASREHDAFFLPRLPANSHDDLTFYQAKLEGSYDWLRLVQGLYKRVVKRIVPTPIEQEAKAAFLNEI
jgi:peptidoglycan/xylan/chitin deacetylase (PgdA/CDA1 family)